MSHTTKLLGIFTALTLLGAGSAIAGSAPGESAESRADLFAAHDSDGDGALSPAEFDAFLAQRSQRWQERRAQAVAEFDSDGDGTLSADEREAMHQARRLERWDSDGDGTLSESESAEARDHREQTHAANLEKYDSDGDGRIGRSEREAARADGAMLGHRRGGRHHGHGPDGGDCGAEPGDVQL